MFSRVGFNRVRDQALVYVGYIGGPLAGSRSYYLLEKKEGEWKVTESVMV